MRRLLLIAVIALFASNSVAQPLPDSARSPKPLRIVAGLDGGVLLTQGDFRRNLGPRSAGVNAFISLRSASGWAIGARLTGSELYKRKETIGLSGLSVDLKTTTSLTRVGLFGQFGPRLMGVRPYGEALLGLHILSTDTKIAGESRKDPNSENQETSVAPAVGSQLEWRSTSEP